MAFQFLLDHCTGFTGFTENLGKETHAQRSPALISVLRRHQLGVGRNFIFRTHPYDKVVMIHSISKLLTSHKWKYKSNHIFENNTDMFSRARSYRSDNWDM